MTVSKKISHTVKPLVVKHQLCDKCLGRLFPKKLHHTSSYTLPQKNSKQDLKPAQKCHICRNLFDSIDSFLKLMLDASLKYSFSSFSVGTIIKPSIIDRDDYIRSKYRLRGVDSIKTSITQELSRLFSKKTKHKVDLLDPDLSVTVNLKEMTCQLRSKSLTLCGRYLKTQRGVPQKQKPCDNCSGKGCRMCDFHGISKFDSVEGIISKYLFEKFGGTTAKFTWIGGEDQSSLVLGPGRPFFVKIQDPRIRVFRSRVIELGFIKINNLKIVSSSPKKPLKFTSLIIIRIVTQDPIKPYSLQRLKTLTKSPLVVYERSGKRSEKKITLAKYVKINPTSFFLSIEAESGVPIKRFVLGDDVTPGISQILGNSCTCKEFDFYEVKTSNNNN